MAVYRAGRKAIRDIFWRKAPIDFWGILWSVHRNAEGTMIKMNTEQLQAFLIEVFPQVHEDFLIMDVTPEVLRVKLLVGERHLRPGGTISGPSMFTLADVGMYLAVLSRIGPEALTVTTNCSIDFMRKPAAGVDMICETRDGDPIWQTQLPHGSPIEPQENVADVLGGNQVRSALRGRYVGSCVS